jgi:hypothetical protein
VSLGSASTHTDFIKRSIGEFVGHRYDGLINITTAGTYNFSTKSDDLSFLHINGTKVVDNGGDHSPRDKVGSYIFSSPGLYPISVRAANNDAGGKIEVYWKPPDAGNRVLIPSSVIFH